MSRRERPRVVYRTATSLDGFIADPGNSLSWLFAVEEDPAQADDDAAFMQAIGVLVMGSTTYEWVLDEADLLAEPTKWHGFYGDRPAFVFTSRELPSPAGADVRFVTGEVTEALPAICAAAGGRDIWVTGGGDLAGQFLDAGALHEITVSIVPVALGAGAPLLPRRLEAARLRLDEVRVAGQFLHATYRVRSVD